MSPRLRRAWTAFALGAGTLAVVVLAVEALIRAQVINPFVVPLPSAVAAAIPRILVEENVAHRFWQTTQEAIAASALVTLVGVAFGVMQRRQPTLRLETETRVAALAAAPIVLLFPLFLVIFGRSATTIVIIGFVAGLPPVIL